MFGFFKKRKRASSLSSIERLGFLKNVFEMLDSEAVPKEMYMKRPIENHVMYFGITVAFSVFRKAMKSEEPLSSANEVETAAMLIIFAKAVNVGSQMSGMTDPETGSIIMQNGSTMLLGTDLHKPSSRALAIMSLQSSTYNLLLKGKPDLMANIAKLSQSYLIHRNDDIIEKLVVCWADIVDYMQ